MTLTGAYLDDGAAHNILIAVSGLLVSLSVDGIPVSSAWLSELVTDCGAAKLPTCVLELGQKPSVTGGTLRLAVTYALARVYPRHAITNATLAPAAPVASTLSFTIVEFYFLPSYNQIGSYTGISIDKCAAICLANPACKVREEFIFLVQFLISTC